VAIFVPWVCPSQGEHINKSNPQYDKDSFARKLENEYF